MLKECLLTNEIIERTQTVSPQRLYPRLTKNTGYCVFIPRVYFYRLLKQRDALFVHLRWCIRSSRNSSNLLKWYVKLISVACLFRKPRTLHMWCQLQANRRKITKCVKNILTFLPLRSKKSFGNCKVFRNFVISQKGVYCHSWVKSIRVFPYFT